MKVTIEFETRDAQGGVLTSQVPAMMEIRNSDYRLVYVENLSQGGGADRRNLTRSTMLLSQSGMRIIRTGELNTDFMYGREMVHNTTYGTPYGTVPITLKTEDYHFCIEGKDGEPFDGTGVCLPENFLIRAEAVYKLIMEEQEPLDMHIKLRIRALPEKRS